MTATLEAVSLRGGYGRLEVLHAVSMSVREGEIVAILGPNGAGKSTLLRTLSGWLPPLGGELRWKGEVVAEHHELPALGVALVPQERNVFGSLTVRENLRVGGASGDDERVRAVFERFPHLEELGDRDASLLSGGERQALAVGMAALREPALMLLDEPTSGLSPVMAQRVRDWVVELQKGGMGIGWVVEQDPDFVLSVATRAYVLIGGEIVFDGDAGQLIGGAAVELVFQGEEV